MMAMDGGYCEAAMALLDGGADARARDQNGMNAIERVRRNANPALASKFEAIWIAIAEHDALGTVVGSSPSLPIGSVGSQKRSL